MHGSNGDLIGNFETNSAVRSKFWSFRKTSRAPNRNLQSRLVSNVH